MKKSLIVLLEFFILILGGYTQSESKQKICFHFIDQYDSIIKPDEIEIRDNEGGFFQLSTDDYCFEYFITPNYAFEIKISGVKYYDYKKTYRIPIPETDTIVLSNIATMINFFIKSDTSIFTDDEVKILQDFFSNKKYHFTSLSLEINIGKYNISEFQNSIMLIYDLYLNNYLHGNFCNLINFSVSFKNDNLDNVLYLFDGEVYKR
jgi:hypothetical protein